MDTAESQPGSQPGAGDGQPVLALRHATKSWRSVPWWTARWSCGPAEIARCILDSLALAYRRALLAAQSLSRRHADVVHIVGRVEERAVVPADGGCA